MILDARSFSRRQAVWEKKKRQLCCRALLEAKARGMELALALAEQKHGGALVAGAST